MAAATSKGLAEPAGSGFGAVMLGEARGDCLGVPLVPLKAEE